jgi:hypothetical protein
MVPPISAGVPASHVRSPSISHIASSVRGGKVVRCLIFCRGSLLPGGGEGVWFFKFLQASLHHASVYPPFFTLPAARWGEACMVPPISAGAPASRVRVSYVFHIASGVRGRKHVGFLIFCRGPRWLVGGKRVWFLQFLQASLPHMSGFPPFLTLPQASGGGSV